MNRSDLLRDQNTNACSASSKRTTLNDDMHGPIPISVAARWWCTYSAWTPSAMHSLYKTAYVEIEMTLFNIVCRVEFEIENKIGNVIVVLPLYFGVGIGHTSVLTIRCNNTNHMRALCSHLPCAKATTFNPRGPSHSWRSK